MTHKLTVLDLLGFPTAAGSEEDTLPAQQQTAETQLETRLSSCVCVHLMTERSIFPLLLENISGSVFLLAYQLPLSAAMCWCFIKIWFNIYFLNFSRLESISGQRFLGF